ncbi:MAG TPA: hypothetical protein VFZ16_07915 [Hyphomicrobiaceae bacterium]|nr:hypothetical protein [Hyphomicrobiaceae bacterium]
MDLGGLLLGGLASAETAAIRLGGSRAIAIVMAALAATLALVGVVLWWRGRRRSLRAASKAEPDLAGVLKQRLRRRLTEPREPFAAMALPGPTVGAGAALEADLDAAAREVLPKASWRCAAAKHLLRQRLNGHAAADRNSHAHATPNGAAHAGEANGSEVACWRQLGALALLHDARDAAAAYARAAELAPGDADLQMLSGVLYLRIGQVEAAEATFRHQLERADGQDGAEPARYRARLMLGDVLLAKDSRDDALAAYEAARSDVLALAEKEPEGGRWQHDAALTHDRIGDLMLADGQLDMALASYRRSLEITEALAKAGPGSSSLQHDLSVVHDRIGEVLDLKGDLNGALESYRYSLAHAEAAAQGEPDRLEWQWELSASLDRMGDILAAKGESADALLHYRRGLTIAEALLVRDPMRLDWQRDLAVSCHKTGLLEAECGHEAAAREALERGRAIIAQLAEIARYQAQWRADLAKFDAALRGLS